MDLCVLCRLCQGSQGAQRREEEGRRLHLPRGLRARDGGLEGGAPRAQEAAPTRGRLVSDRYISYACAGWDVSK